MKKQILKAIGSASLAVLMLVSAHVWVSAQSSEQGLTGSWNVRVTIRDCGSGSPFYSFPTMRSYNLGGTMQEAGADRMFQPGHGVWKPSTRQTYSQSFHFFQLNTDGTLLGTVKVTGNIDVARRGDAFTAITTFQVLDPDGNVQASGCATESATRYE